jgi:hypothetical protein
MLLIFFHGSYVFSCPNTVPLNAAFDAARYTSRDPVAQNLHDDTALSLQFSICVVPSHYSVSFPTFPLHFMLSPVWTFACQPLSDARQGNDHDTCAAAVTEWMEGVVFRPRPEWLSADADDDDGVSQQQQRTMLQTGGGGPSARNDLTESPAPPKLLPYAKATTDGRPVVRMKDGALRRVRGALSFVGKKATSDDDPGRNPANASPTLARRRGSGHTEFWRAVAARRPVFLPLRP